jgi:hypothetical protein
MPDLESKGPLNDLSASELTARSEDGSSDRAPKWREKPMRPRLVWESLPSFKLPSAREVWEATVRGWENERDFWVTTCAPLALKEASVFFVRIGFIINIGSDGAMAAACLLSGNRVPAAFVLGVIGFNHLLAGAMLVRAYYSTRGPWTWLRVIVALLQTLIIGPLAVLAMDIFTFFVAIGWERLANTQTRLSTMVLSEGHDDRRLVAINTIAAYGTARASLQALAHAAPMFFVQAGILVAIGTPNDLDVSNTRIGELDGALTGAVACAMLGTVLNLFFHALRLRRYAKDVGMTSRE